MWCCVGGMHHLVLRDGHRSRVFRLFIRASGFRLSSDPHSPMKKSAFTLIELLVVIAIIAVLAGIALPVFNKAQERARATSDAANLRQLGLGMQGYLNDNDEQMFALAGGGSGAANVSWPNTLQSKYVTSWKVFRSPFDRVSPVRPDTEKGPNVPVSYGINVNNFGVNASKFTAPTLLVMMAAAMVPNRPQPEFAGTSESNPQLEMPQGGAGRKQGTHNNRSQINVLFADSHVESVAWAQFSDATTEEGLKRWFPEGEQKEKQP